MMLGQAADIGETLATNFSNLVLAREQVLVPIRVAILTPLDITTVIQNEINNSFLIL
jgi:hypothetical protein